MLKWVIFLTLLFIVLKVIGVIQLPWIVTLAPILSWIGFIILILTGICIVLGGIVLVVELITKLGQ